MAVATKDPLREIGEIIRSHRDGNGLSIEELARESRVSISHIRNIEDACRDELPEEAYLIGFLHKLFRTLKVRDTDGIIENYRNDEGEYILQYLVNLNAPDLLEQDTKWSFSLSDLNSRHIYSIVIVVLLLLTWIVFTQNQSQTLKPDPKKVTLLEKTGPKLNLDNLNKKIAGIDFGFNKSKSNEVKVQESSDRQPLPKVLSSRGSGAQFLDLQVVDKAWVQVIGVSQKKILFEGDVSPQAGPNRIKLYDDLGFVVATGNAGAFKVNDEGKEFILGKRGELIKWYHPKSVRAVYRRWSRKSEPSKVKKISKLQYQKLRLASNTDDKLTDPFVSKVASLETSVGEKSLRRKRFRDRRRKS